MRDDIPWPLDTPWGYEARRLRERRVKVGETVDHLVIRYADMGNLGPLIDLVGRCVAEPGERALKHIAAMFDREVRGQLSNINVQYEFGFHKIRGRGRPPLEGDDSQTYGTVLATLQKGIHKMAEGKSPGRRFWLYLCAALDPSYRKTLQWNFPVKAKLQSIQRRKGRRRDPGLDSQHEIIALTVAKHRRSKYETAIDDASKKLGVSLSTTRKAYDRKLRS
jgi:hypothetical protein